MTAYPLSSLSPIDLAWAQHPNMPRAVAALTSLAAYDEAVANARQATAREEATFILADSYALRDAFVTTYGIAHDVAMPVLDRTMDFSATHPDWQVGEHVIHLPLLALLERLGYIDGLRPPHDPPSDQASPGLEDPETPSLTARVDRWWLPAYHRGFRAGEAERQLKAWPDLLRALQGAVVPALAGNMAERPTRRVRLLREGLRRVLRDLRAQRATQDSQAAARILASQLSRDAQRVIAARWVSTIVAQQACARPVAVAAALRALMQTKRQAGTTASAARRRVVTAQWMAALRHAATLGFSHQLIAQLEQPSALPPRIDALLAQHPRDAAVGREHRALFDALAQAPAVGIWQWQHLVGPVLAPGLVPPTQVSLLRVASWNAAMTHLEQVAPGVAHWARHVRDCADASGWGREGLPERVMARTMSERLEAWVSSVDLPKVAIGQIMRLAALEERFEQRRERFSAALCREALWQSAAPTLEVLDVRQAALARAEGEFALLGGEADVEAAESWVRSALREAVQEGWRIDPHDSRMPALVTEDAATLVCRAWVIVRGLEARAAHEATRILDAVMHSDLPSGSTREIRRQIVSQGDRAWRGAQQQIDGFAGRIPGFAPRLREATQAAILRWMADTSMALA